MLDDPMIFTPAPVVPDCAGAVLTVDLKVLQDNWRKIAREVTPAECAATVKGDAYGIGIEPAVRALWSAGCRIYFVALPHEGKAVRQFLPEADIYVMNGLMTGLAVHYRDHDLIPCLASPEEIVEWSDFCKAEGQRLACALHIDTGINRLGLTGRQVEQLAASPQVFDRINLRLILSHLACGDDPGSQMNHQQSDAFDRLRGILPDAKASLANSPGCFLGNGFTHDIVRPGVALYGGNPFATRPNPMSPVVHLYAPILQVRDVPVGGTVGYSATWTAARPSKIEVLGLGYRDGYPRALSYPANDGPAHVMIGGHYAPVVGRVSMDLITVDVTDISEDFARRGGNAEMMGDHVTVDDIARWADTIPYEILTHLGSRYTRLYSTFDSD